MVDTHVYYYVNGVYTFYLLQFYSPSRMAFHLTELIPDG